MKHEERQIRELVVSGDVSAAATEALRLVGPQVLRHLRCVLRDEDDARDAFSEFAEVLWKGLPSFRWESSLRTWAYRLAHSAAGRLKGSAWRRLGRRFVTGEASNVAEEIRTRTSRKVERQRQALEKLLLAQSFEDRTLVALRVGQGLS